MTDTKLTTPTDEGHVVEDVGFNDPDITVIEQRILDYENATAKNNTIRDEIIEPLLSVVKNVQVLNSNNEIIPDNVATLDSTARTINALLVAKERAVMDTANLRLKQKDTSATVDMSDTISELLKYIKPDIEHQPVKDQDSVKTAISDVDKVISDIAIDSTELRVHNDDLG